MAHRISATRMLRALRRLPAILGLAMAGAAFQAVPAEFARDIHAWTPPPGGPSAPLVYPDLGCDPDLLIWKHYCIDCIPNRPLEHCSDAALR